MSDRLNLLLNTIMLCIEYLRGYSKVTAEEKAEIFKVIKEGITSVFTL